ncbi:sigma-70 family RNA polymerase sigma factor [Photobacterium alginatilyticum]|uniref:Sigma-70 family RNA polymerase sigma factor n=1 Tax=Photobacterium alginatilyticum TaxID=1775171 RepID=A0ABW9YPF9_9GAMM|nr:sigma-70 family RNA polymerase sigma factor [Photobacterium alginatilyticum]NBI55696.1 sigma-70 family RNA polymerase sigma factor [Photobacterium alginatilyticum]
MLNEESPAIDVASLLFNIANLRCKQSYEKLFVMLAPKLLNFSRKQLRDDAMAMEVVQETMLKIWLKAHLYDESKGAALTWIYSVARNVKFDLLRKSKHQNDWIQGDDLWPTLSEEQDPDRLPKEFHAIVTRELKELVNTLPPAQAEVVRLICLQGASHQDVADALGVPLGTIKSRLRLALQKMKEALDD